AWLAGARDVNPLDFKNTGEERSGPWIGLQHLCVGREAACRRALGEMQECEERLIGFLLHPQGIEPAFAGSKPVRLEGASAAWHCKELAGAAAEQIGMPLLVPGVAEVEPAQHRVPRQLGGARQIAAAVRLGLCEPEQLAPAAPGASPDPPI